MATPLPTLEELGGCIFVKPANKNGYGYSYYKGKQRKAHRVAYEKAYGEIPEGMHVDHICHNVAIKHNMCKGEASCIHRSCVNPEHLQVVTPLENQLNGLRGLRNRKYCTNGHLLTEDNIKSRTRKDGKTGDYCLDCYRIYNRRAAKTYRAKQKELKAGDIN